MEFLKIDPSEVLRYLGYAGQELDGQTAKMLENGIRECLSISRPRYVYQLFDCHPSDGGISVDGSGLVLKGSSIGEHLEHAEKVAVMAATLGAEFDRYIPFTENRSMTKALILDACGTDYIEKVCDTVEEEIRQLAASQGYETNFRFSPGYGDFPLEQQPEITRLLDTPRRIGLTCTPNLILLPRKSVTAVIGFLPKGQEKQQRRPACEQCQLRDGCNLRKEGRFCGR